MAKVCHEIGMCFYVIYNVQCQTEFSDIKQFTIHEINKIRVNKYTEEQI